MADKMSSQERYKKLLDKVNSLNLGGGGWWRPPVGVSTIRILPAVGSMDYFFVEVGQHYLGEGNNKPFYCPSICTEGEQPCPICEVNEELYKAGEKEAASKFRAGRAFFMNIIDRNNPGQGVQKFAPGTTIFQAIASAVGDPDYGDVSDPDEGYDIKIERVGEGRENTKYQTRPVKRSSPMGTEEQINEWLGTADDLKAFVLEQLMPYDELAKKSGVDVYFANDDEEEEAPPPKKAAASAKRAPEPDEDEEEPPARASKSASQVIGERVTEREKRAQLLRRGR